MDEPRPGAPNVTDEDVGPLAGAILESSQADATHWSTQDAGRRAEPIAVSGLAGAAGGRPAAAPARAWKASNEPSVTGKVRDVLVGQPQLEMSARPGWHPVIARER
jgi:hypothetical protein